jgi:hypothetical protein
MPAFLNSLLCSTDMKVSVAENSQHQRSEFLNEMPEVNITREGLIHMLAPDDSFCDGRYTI